MVSDIRASAARLLTPFDSKIEVPEYFIRHSETDAKRWMAVRGACSMEELAKALQAEPDHEFFVKDGALFSTSTRNPQGRWDYYQVGGSYGGFISEKECLMIARDRNWDDAVCSNLARPDSISPANLPSVIVTPEGVWHDSFDHGWRMMAADAEKQLAWQKWELFALPLLSSYQSHLALGLDMHS